MTTPQTFQIALQHHQAGKIAKAETFYRQVLAAEPRHADALHRLGLIAHQVGRNDIAVDLIRRAIAVEPNASAFHFSLGETYRTLGRREEAIAAYRRAIQFKPDCLEAHINLGNTLWEQGHLEEAIAACRRAIQLKPDCAEAHIILGNALYQQDRLVEATAAYRQAIQFKPDCAEVHSNLGNALKEQGRLDESIAACRRAIQLKPDCAEAHSNLGNALRDQGYLEEAIAVYRRAIQLKPDCAEAHSNLGTALKDQGRLDEALAAYHRAIQVKPDYTEAIWNTALVLMVRGDFERGLPLYEARRDMGIVKESRRNFPQPMWKGEALNGQRVLLHVEGGFGDTLQFVRYAPLIAQRGGQVIVEIQPELKTLFTSIEGVSQIIEFGEPLPAFDLHCPMLSLPLAFGTRAETIPAPIPYLRADAGKVARWRARLEPGGPLKVGLVWAGGERSQPPKLCQVNRRRSMRLSQFAPLAEVPGVVFVSLQKGPPAIEAQALPEGMTLLDWTDELHDFADTAALIEALDLVISVDTAVVHLAGALGKPVWLLNRYDTCWRWLMERADSPWYPTMRIFRQQRFMDWEPVLASVCEQLALLVATPAGR